MNRRQFLIRAAKGLTVAGGLGAFSHGAGQRYTQSTEARKSDTSYSASNRDEIIAQRLMEEYCLNKNHKFFFEIDQEVMRNLKLPKSHFSL